MRFISVSLTVSGCEQDRARVALPPRGHQPIDLVAGMNLSMPANFQASAPEARELR